MDLTALHKGVIQFAASAAAVLNISIAPAAPPSEGLLQSPQLLESRNLPLEINKTPEEVNQLPGLNAVTEPETEGLKMVFKIPEAKATEIVTVEQPPVLFTVTAPTPKPPTKPLEEADSQTPQLKKSEEKTEPKASEKPKNEESKKSETKAPESSPVITPGTPNADILFRMTNDHRAKIGKLPFEKDDRLCKIAQDRAPQVNGELASGSLHKGFKALNLPYWAAENIAAYQTMKENFDFLITDYIHKKAIESDNKYSCTACSGTSCSQIFSSFTPR